MSVEHEPEKQLTNNSEEVHAAVPSEASVAIPETLQIIDIDGGGRIVKMKLPWGKERRILRIIGDLLSSVPSEFTFGVTENENPGMALLQYLTADAPDKVTEIVAILLDLNPDDVDKKYDGDAVINFAIPFITHYAAKWGERLQGLPIAQFLTPRPNA